MIDQDIAELERKKALLVERGQRHDSRVSELTRRVVALETEIAEGRSKT